MTDAPKLQAGYVGRVDTVRTGFVGPPGPKGAGKGWKSAAYSSATGKVTFVSDDGLGFGRRLAQDGEDEGEADLGRTRA